MTNYFSQAVNNQVIMTIKYIMRAINNFFPPSHLTRSLPDKY